MQDPQRLFEQQKAAFLRDPYPTYRTRLDRLARLDRLVTRYASRFEEAISADFGYRSACETQLAELVGVRTEIQTARKSLKRWMRDQRAASHPLLWSARNTLRAQPRGVVGNVSPWNYPLLLSLQPVVSALAAGNRVMLKVSERVPAFGALLAEAVAETFSPEEFAVVLGDVETAKAFCALPFDFLVYTGSSAVGSAVMQSAARNLTPVLLELGGACQAVIAPDARFEHAVERILVGKYLNAGQTCIAPNTVWVNARGIDTFVNEVKRQSARLIPDATALTSVVSDDHVKRLDGLLTEAQERGAWIVPVREAFETPAHPRQRIPVLVIDPPADCRICREEIFGPVLLVKTYLDIECVTEDVKRAHRDQLALYWFDENRPRMQRVAKELSAGGITFNDTLLHAAQVSLPFGGVGRSGMGAYHGAYGFDAMTHWVPVTEQRRGNFWRLLNPPYSRWIRRCLQWMTR